MIIVYSTKSKASDLMGKYLIDDLGFEENGTLNGFERFSYESTDLIKTDSELTQMDFLDDRFKTDCFVFLSRHSSNKEVPCLTVHAQGNWSDTADLGGRPKTLSVSAPAKMLAVLTNMNSVNNLGVDIKYEATHHGPCLNTPSFFAEAGGTDSVEHIRAFAKIVAESVFKAMDNEFYYSKVVAGFGGGHYPIKFTAMALDKGVAFSHIMSKYNIDNTDMIEQSLTKSDIRPEEAIIEWKSIKSSQREGVIRVLNSLGMDYVKV